MFRNALRHIVWCGVLTAGTASAQSAREVEGLRNDLCGCIEHIGPAASDRAFDQAFRYCLENVVLLHPATVRALLHAAPEEGAPAFRIGRMLGTLLEKDCKAYGPIKLRLRDAHERSLLKNGSCL